MSTETTLTIHVDTQGAAELLLLSPRTLERWRIEGKGPSYRKFGKRVAYNQAALLKWAEDQTHSSTSDAA